MQLTIDCADPQAMVAFWAKALDYVPEPPPDGHATWRAYWSALGVPDAELPPGAGDIPESIIDPSGHGPRIWFQQVPEPKVAKNRWHLDLMVDGGRGAAREVRVQRVSETVDRLVAAGAALLRITDEVETGTYAAAMQDPEGNEFDVV